MNEGMNHAELACWLGLTLEMLPAEYPRRAEIQRLIATPPAFRGDQWRASVVAESDECSHWRAARWPREVAENNIRTALAFLRDGDIPPSLRIKGAVCALERALHAVTTIRPDVDAPPMPPAGPAAAPVSDESGSAGAGLLSSLSPLPVVRLGPGGDFTFDN